MVDCVDGLVAHQTQSHQPFEIGQLATRMQFAVLRGEVKPTIVWLLNCRRLIVSHKHYPQLFEEFVQLGCLMILLNRF